jgi:hypothetical protein
MGRNQRKSKRGSQRGAEPRAGQMSVGVEGSEIPDVVSPAANSEPSHELMVKQDSPIECQSGAIEHLPEQVALGESDQGINPEDCTTQDLGVISHFWVCTYPYFDTSLFVIPPLYKDGYDGGCYSSPSSESSQTTNSKTAAAISTVTVYDPDGIVINSLRYTAHEGTVGMIELGPLFGGGKMQSGMKFGQVVVRSPRNFSHKLRMMNKACGAVLSEGRVLLSSDMREQGHNGLSAANYPLNLGKGRQSLLTLVNRTAGESVVRCKLLLGKRSPEVDCRIPAYGSRVLHLESVFSLMVPISTEKTVQSYLRLSLKNGQPSQSQAVGAQIIERNIAQGESEYFVAVA